jgi:hypothetical protein
MSSNVQPCAARPVRRAYASRVYGSHAVTVRQYGQPCGGAEAEAPPGARRACAAQRRGEGMGPAEWRAVCIALPFMIHLQRIHLPFIPRIQPCSAARTALASAAWPDGLAPDAAGPAAPVPDAAADAAAAAAQASSASVASPEPHACVLPSTGAGRCRRSSSTRSRTPHESQDRLGGSQHQSISRPLDLYLPSPSTHQVQYDI